MKTIRNSISLSYKITKKKIKTADRNLNLEIWMQQFLFKDACNTPSNEPFEPNKRKELGCRPEIESS